MSQETEEKYISESKRQFNEFQSQSRARMEYTVKLVLIVSGGMLTLSIGSVLNNPSYFTPNLLHHLEYSWLLFFYSIASSLLLMLLHLIGTFHMGLKWYSRIENKITNTEKIKTWEWLRYLVVIVGSTSILSCILGVGLIAYTAINLAQTIVNA